MMRAFAIAFLFGAFAAFFFFIFTGFFIGFFMGSFSFLWNEKCVAGSAGKETTVDAGAYAILAVALF